MAWNISNILVNEAIANKKAGGGSDLTDRVEALETTVGDETGGLVKEVDDLQTDVSSLNPNTFSTTETKVGTWLGNDLYRSVYSCGALPNKTTKTVETILTNINIVHMFGYAKNTTNGNVIPLPRVDATDYCALSWVASSNSISIKSGGDLSGLDESYVVLEYTKNTEPANNTRKRGK